MEVGDFAMPPNPRHAKVNVLTHPIGAARALRVSRLELAKFRDARHVPSSGMRATQIALVSGSVERTPAVRVLEEDISAPTDLGAFDAIRVANVLNLSYYSAPEIRRMLSAIAARLTPRGLLLVARTERRTNHATLVRVEAGRLTCVATLNRGSEVASFLANVLVE